MTIRSRLSFLLLALAIGACASHAPREFTEGRPQIEAAFAVDDAPIHPLLVLRFIGWISDGGAVVRSVDVCSAAGTDEFGEQVVVHRGLVSCRVPETTPEETFGYRHIGTLDDGTFVLITEHGTGGTGVFRTLLLVRLTRQEVRSRGVRRPAVILSLVDEFPLGDRDDGQVEVRGNHVIVSASSHRPQAVTISGLEEETHRTCE